MTAEHNISKQILLTLLPSAHYSHYDCSFFLALFLFLLLSKSNHHFSKTSNANVTTHHVYLPVQQLPSSSHEIEFVIQYTDNLDILIFFSHPRNITIKRVHCMGSIMSYILQEIIFTVVTLSYEFTIHLEMLH